MIHQLQIIGAFDKPNDISNINEDQSWSKKQSSTHLIPSNEMPSNLAM